MIYKYLSFNDFINNFNKKIKVFGYIYHVRIEKMSNISINDDEFICDITLQSFYKTIKNNYADNKSSIIKKKDTIYIGKKKFTMQYLSYYTVLYEAIHNYPVITTNCLQVKCILKPKI